MRFAVLTLAVCGLAAITGCEDNQSGDNQSGYSKPGGGGRSQSYDGSTGRYNLALGTAAALGLLAWAAARRRPAAALRAA